MSMEKVSLTLDEKVVREARKRAGRGGLSAYVNDVLQRELQADKIRKLLQELDEEYGPVPPEVREEVRRRWLEGERRLRRYGR